MFPGLKHKILNSRAGRFSLLLVVVMVLAACSRQYTVDERLERALEFKSAGDHQAAIIELKHALQDDNRNVQAARLLGEIYVLVGNGPSAEKELVRARENGAGDVRTTVLLGEALLMQGKYEQVLREVGSASGAGSPEIEAELLVLRAGAHFGMRDPVQAHARYTEALALDGNSIAALLGLARIELVESRHERVEMHLATAARIVPDDVEIWITRGSLRQAQSRYEEAEQAFGGAVDRVRSTGMTEQKFRAMMGLATVQILRERFTEAEENLRVLTAEASGHLHLGYLNAWLAYQQGNYEKARTDLLQVERQAPAHLPTVLLLGAVNYALGSYEQANTYLTRFVNAVPTHVQGRKLLGATRLRLDRAGEAIDILTPALGHTEEQDAQLLLMIGQAAARSGDLEGELGYLREAARVAPDDQTIRAGIARAYLQQGSIDEAIRELESITGGVAAGREVQTLLVYAHLRNGDFNAARAVVDRLIEEAPNEPGLHVMQGGIEMIAGRRTEARVHFNTALKLQADHVPALIGLGRMDLEDGRLAEASRHFDRVLQSDGQSASAMMGHAQIAEQQGQREQALSWLEKARVADTGALIPRLVLANHYLQAQDVARALLIAREAAQIAPEAPGVLHVLGRSQAGAGDLRGAHETYASLVQLHPQPLAYLELAAIQSRLNEHTAARASFQRALELDGSLLSAKVGLALLERTTGRWEEALQLAQRIQREHPDTVVGYSLAGELYMERGDAQNAWKSFSQAHDREPSPHFGLRLAQAYSADGRQTEAMTTLEQALSRHADSTVLRATLGAVYQQMDRTAAAQAEYDRVLQQDPANVTALNNSALLSLGRDNEKALRLAREASRLAPTNPLVADTLGWIKVQSGHIQEGLEILNGLASREEPAIRYHLAAALALAGRETEARERLEALLRTSDVFKEREEAQLLLQRLSRPVSDG